MGKSKQITGKSQQVARVLVSFSLMKLTDIQCCFSQENLAWCMCICKNY